MTCTSFPLLPPDLQAPFERLPQARTRPSSLPSASRPAMRILPLLIATSLTAGSALAAGPCEGPKPWKSPNADTYPEPALRTFYALARQSSQAYEHGRAVEARALARQYLAAAARFPCDWNQGNAVHNANTILGLLAEQEGDRAAAVAHLAAAGESRGSPQINSFGPSLMLAQRLARAGEFDAVAAYVRAIRRFWEADDTTLAGMQGSRDPSPMTTWLDTLARRQVPDFGMNAKRPP